MTDYLTCFGIDDVGRMYSLGEVNFIQGMLDFGNPKNSVGLKPIAVRLRQTLSGARSQALPGNVFLAALPPVQFVGGRATSEHVPRQSLGTSTGASLRLA